MQDDVNLVIFEPARIFYVLTPKCGSSSMVNIFLTMAGFDPRDREIRKLAWAASADGRLAARGLHISRLDTNAVLAARDRHPNYTCLANIRDPYDRILSNYNNKLNRYTKAHARGIYWYGKLRQFLEGPKSWPLVNRGNAHMQARISFEQMLEGLERHGVGFDSHYALQCELLALDRIRYDRLFRLETLDVDFRAAMQGYGIPSEMLDRVQAMPRNNRTQNDGRADPRMTPRAKEIIARLYARDFAALGYPL